MKNLFLDGLQCHNLEIDCKPGNHQKDFLEGQQKIVTELKSEPALLHNKERIVQPPLTSQEVTKSESAISATQHEAKIKEYEQTKTTPTTESAEMQIHFFAQYLPNVDPTTFPVIHPIAEHFPMMEMDEIQALAGL